MEGNEQAELKIHTGNISFESEELCKAYRSVQPLLSEMSRLTTRAIAELDLEERGTFRVDPVAGRIAGQFRNWFRLTECCLMGNLRFLRLLVNHLRLRGVDSTGRRHSVIYTAKVGQLDCSKVLDHLFIGTGKLV